MSLANKEPSMALQLRKSPLFRSIGTFDRLTHQLNP